MKYVSLCHCEYITVFKQNLYDQFFLELETVTVDVLEKLSLKSENGVVSVILFKIL